MNNQFVTYRVALALKELGFDEQCMRFFSSKNNGRPVLPERMSQMLNTKNSSIETSGYCAAPLWQQAVKFLLDKLSFYYPMLEFQIFSDNSGCWYQSPDKVVGGEKLEIDFDSLEEAVLKAIELWKKKK